MPSYSLWHAYGPKEMREAVPSSAFSAGDVLCFDSNSSLSRMPADFGLPVAGVAASASTSSANNKVPYIVPQADSVFWSECTTGSQMTPGELLDLEYTSARFMVSTSQNTGTVTIERNSEDIGGQSVQSRVLVKFVRSAFTGTPTEYIFRASTGV